jgi:hypothetical protein
MLIKAVDIPKTDILYKYSNPKQAQKNAKLHLGDDTVVYKSTRKDKKYMIYDPMNHKYVHFGGMNPPYEDFLKHKNNKRQTNYFKRALNIKGNWRENPYSSNNLSIWILWM